MVNKRWPLGPVSNGVTTPVSLTRWPSKCSWPPNTSAKAVIGIPTPLPHRGNCVVSFLASEKNPYFVTTDSIFTYLPGYILPIFFEHIFMFFGFFEKLLQNNVKVLYVYNTFQNSYLWSFTEHWLVNCPWQIILTRFSPFYLVYTLFSPTAFSPTNTN